VFVKIPFSYYTRLRFGGFLPTLRALLIYLLSYLHTYHIAQFRLCKFLTAKTVLGYRKLDTGTEIYSNYVSK